MKEEEIRTIVAFVFKCIYFGWGGRGGRYHRLSGVQ